MDYGTEDEGFLDKMKAALEGGALGKYLLYAVVILGVLGAGYYLLFLQPKPATVVVVVRELDGGEVDGAQVYFSDPSGNPVGETKFTEGGSAVFDYIPTQTPLYVVADAGSGYAPGRQSVQFESGTAGNVEILVEKRNGIEITATDIPSSFAGSCKDRFYIEVTNFGEDPYNAMLLSEGGGEFSKYFAVQSGGKVIGSNQSVNFSVFAELPGGENAGEGVSLDGAIRVRGTSRKVAIAGPVGSPLQIEVSPNEIYFTPESDKATRITVSNAGSQALENFGARVVLQEELQQQCGADGSRCFKIEVLGDERSRNAITPGSKVDLVVGITPPSRKEKYYGSLELVGTCMNSPGITIPIVLDLRVENQ